MTTEDGIDAQMVWHLITQTATKETDRQDAKVTFLRFERQRQDRLLQEELREYSRRQLKRDRLVRFIPERLAEIIANPNGCFRS